MKLPIELTAAASQYNTSLHCPVCGGHNLHHHNVAVYTSLCPEDDFTREQEVLVYENGVVRDHLVTRDSGRNPSSRRDGIRISMTCEVCSDDPRNPEDVVPDLIIYQHKGTTYIEWDNHRLLPLTSARRPTRSKDGL